MDACLANLAEKRDKTISQSTKDAQNEIVSVPVKKKPGRPRTRPIRSPKPPLKRGRPKLRQNIEPIKTNVQLDTVQVEKIITSKPEPEVNRNSSPFKIKPSEYEEDFPSLHISSDEENVKGKQL